MLTRRSLALTALPIVAMGQPARPSLRVAVPKIANSGTLDPLREQSSNASERYIGLILETLIGRDLTPGLATAWHRADARTVDLTLRPGVVTHDGRTLTADDVPHPGPGSGRDSGCGHGPVHDIHTGPGAGTTAGRGWHADRTGRHRPALGPVCAGARWHRTLPRR